MDRCATSPDMLVSHVRNIMIKLGFNARTQIPSWFTAALAAS